MTFVKEIFSQKLLKPSILFALIFPLARSSNKQDDESWMEENQIKQCFTKLATFRELLFFPIQIVNITISDMESTNIVFF